MPDTKGYWTPFTDYVADKMPFNIAPTLGDKPNNFPVPPGPLSGTVTPKELPDSPSDLWHGPKQ